MGEDGIRVWPFDGNVPETNIFIDEQSKSLFFTSDDRSLVIVTHGVSVYDLDVALLLDRAQQIVGRDITVEEWQEYFPGESFRSVFKSADTSNGVAPRD